MLEPQAPGTIGMFLPSDGEVDLGPVAGVLRTRGWRTALPVVGTGRELTFHEWTDGTLLRPNRFGIDEPEATVAVPTAELDVVVVPAVAVDRHGNRLGFGAGFYDRVLAGRRAGAVLIAAVLSVQVVDGIDAEPWDVPVDVVLTEGGVVGGRAVSGGA